MAIVTRRTPKSHLKVKDERNVEYFHVSNPVALPLRCLHPWEFDIFEDADNFRVANLDLLAEHTTSVDWHAAHSTPTAPGTTPRRCPNHPHLRKPTTGAHTREATTTRKGAGPSSRHGALGSPYPANKHET